MNYFLAGLSIGFFLGVGVVNWFWMRKKGD